MTQPTEQQVEEFAREVRVSVAKLDEEKRIVYGVVYAPNVIDTHGELMLAEDIEVMAHRFMQLKLDETIDRMHDNDASAGHYPVESFIARAGDPDYPEGAWVLGTKIVDDETWDAVKRGDLNGYSFEALVKKLPAVVLLEVTRDNFGLTEDADGHRHIFFAEINEDGKIFAGRTTTENGHSHEILRGTATELADGHRHRFFV